MTTARAVRTLCFVPPPRLRTKRQNALPNLRLCSVNVALHPPRPETSVPGAGGTFGDVSNANSWPGTDGTRTRDLLGHYDLSDLERAMEALARSRREGEEPAD